MHELSVVEGVLEQVSARVGDRRVARVRLRIGAATAIVPDALRFCFDVCTRATSMEGAALEIESVPVRARCNACGAERELPDALPLCECGSVDLAMVSGDELLIQDVEVI